MDDWKRLIELILELIELITRLIGNSKNPLVRARLNRMLQRMTKFKNDMADGQD